MRTMKSFSSNEYHYVYGEVYAPLRVDTDGESMTAGDIQNLAHDFVASGKVTNIDRQYERIPCGVEVVESFIARKGDSDYAEGSWVLGVRMKDGPVWDAVQSGDFNGFSVDMLVKKSPQKVLVELTKIASGDTEASVAGLELPAHSHAYYVEFGNDGRVSFGVTDEIFGHRHKISGTVVTDNSLGHSHRYFVE